MCFSFYRIFIHGLHMVLVHLKGARSCLTVLIAVSFHHHFVPIIYLPSPLCRRQVVSVLLVPVMRRPPS